MKFGKDENRSKEKYPNSNEDSSENIISNNSNTNQDIDTKSSNESTIKSEDSEVIKHSDKETDVKNLRKIIKFEPNDKTNEESASNKKTEPTQPYKIDEPEGDLKNDEQGEKNPEILDNIKDFDFQIKENKANINSLTQKIDILSKDIDDLVSLYEIVSDQMNPFVGLSKVTKKRIDALENFTKQVEDLHGRVGELESFAERSGVKFKTLDDMQTPTQKRINVDEIIGDKSDGMSPNIESNNEPMKSQTTDDSTDKISFEMSDIDSDKIDILIDELIETLIDSNEK